MSQALLFPSAEQVSEARSSAELAGDRLRKRARGARDQPVSAAEGRGTDLNGFF